MNNIPIWPSPTKPQVASRAGVVEKARLAERQELAGSEREESNLRSGSALKLMMMKENTTDTKAKESKRAKSRRNKMLTK